MDNSSTIISLENWIKKDSDLRDLYLTKGLSVFGVLEKGRTWVIDQTLTGGPSETVHDPMFGRRKFHSRFDLRLFAKAVGRSYELRLMLLLSSDRHGVEDRIDLSLSATEAESLKGFEKEARLWQISEDGILNGRTIIQKLHRALSRLPATQSVVWVQEYTQAS